MRSLKPLRNYLHISIWLFGYSFTNPSQKTSPAVSIHPGSSFIQLSIHTETTNSFLGLKQTARSTLYETASYLKLSGCCPAWSRLVHRPVRLTYRWFDLNGRRLVRVDAVSRQSHRLNTEYILFIGLQAMNCKPERRKTVFSMNIGSLLNQMRPKKRPGLVDGLIVDGLPLSTSNLTAVQVVSQNALCYFGLLPLQ